MKVIIDPMMICDRFCLENLSVKKNYYLYIKKKFSIMLVNYCAMDTILKYEIHIDNFYVSYN